VADVSRLSDAEVLVHGLSPGLTSLMVWDRHGNKHPYEIEVAATGLKKTMIQVDVQVLELIDTRNWDIGIDWPVLVNAAGRAVEQAVPPLEKFGTFTRGSLDIRVRALVGKNKARILAKPKLLTLSGEKATFLAGGEIPVVIVDGEGRSSTDYKPYGVRLDIRPRADGEDNINADIQVELSNIDAGNAVVNNGIAVPALRTRRVQNTIYVKKNGTIVIAGLIQEQSNRVRRGIPLLSDLPLLGELFSLTRWEKSNTELVVFVTPRIL
jgi:pilus assembly protein CpaC